MWFQLFLEFKHFKPLENSWRFAASFWFAYLPPSFFFTNPPPLIFSITIFFSKLKSNLTLVWCFLRRREVCGQKLFDIGEIVPKLRTQIGDCGRAYIAQARFQMFKNVSFICSIKRHICRDWGSRFCRRRCYRFIADRISFIPISILDWVGTHSALINQYSVGDSLLFKLLYNCENAFACIGEWKSRLWISWTHSPQREIILTPAPHINPDPLQLYRPDCSGNWAYYRTKMW